MKGPRWQRPGDPALFEAIAAVWNLGRQIRPRRFPPGVHKHASIEEMNRVQERWTQQHVDSLRARMLRGE